MTEPLITVDALIDADPPAVWDTLTRRQSPMFLGAEVDTDWRAGSPMTMTGEYGGKRFEDHGEIRVAEAQHRLAFTHFSGADSGNGNLVDIRLEPEGEGTRVTLSQTPLGGDPPDPGKIAGFRKTWEAMLAALKNAAEHRSVAPV